MRERKLRINHVAIAQMPIIIIFSRSTNAHHNGAYQMCAHFSSYNSSVFVVFMIAFFRMKSFFFLHTTPGNEPILLLLFIRLLHTLKYQTNVATLSIGCAVIIQLITNFEFSFAKCQRAEIYNEFVAEKKKHAESRTRDKSGDTASHEIMFMYSYRARTETNGKTQIECLTRGFSPKKRTMRTIPISRDQTRQILVFIRYLACK